MNLFLIWAWSVTSFAAEVPLKPVEAVDLDRYSGRWFAVALIRRSFQRFCIDQTSAVYERDGDRVRVRNQCRSWLFGVDWSITGQARAVSPSQSSLRVEFRKRDYDRIPVDPNYVVIGLGQNYEWALIGVPDRELGWLLVRDPQNSDDAFLEAERLLTANGYNPCDFLLEPQTGFDGRRTDSLCTQVKQIRALRKAKEAAPSLVKKVAQELQAELMRAIATRGPEHALSYCHENALELTQKHTSQDREVLSLKRTSLKIRNPKNAPDEREREVLEGWGDRKEPRYEVDLRQERVHAYFPIFVQPQCVLCHGERATLPSPVSKKLDELYPKDEATGYAVGSLRGLFHVEVPFKDLIP